MSSPSTKTSDRAPRFWLWHVRQGDGEHERLWAVRAEGEDAVFTHKVWINTLAETSRAGYIKGEGYVSVNDDGSISIN